MSSNLDSFDVLAVLAYIPFPIIFCVVYVPPSPTEDSFHNLFAVLSDLFSRNLPVLILGDLNAPDINWHTYFYSSSYSNSLCDFIFEYNLCQHINVPTHIKGNKLDLILTSSENLVDNVSVMSQPNDFPSSDHF